MSIVTEQPRYVGGRIQLMQCIGEGGCASVWLGRHRETNALLAAKLVHSHRDRDLLAARFQREAELSARLVHRNLVRVHDYFREDDGQPVLLMEYLRGQTVEEVLQVHGALPTYAAVAVVIDVLRGLAQAHALGIIHRDLKPSNIFLAAEPDGVIIPKLLDFGIAKVRDDNAILLTQEGEVLGTPAYMSPEQVRGGEVGPASDVFTLGAVLYEMLTGELAFSASSPAAALAAVLERTIERHPAIPPELWAVMARALSKKIDDRQSSAEELRLQLEEAIGYGEATGQEAIRALHVLVPTPPTLPPLTPPPFLPSSSHIRLRGAPTQRISSSDEASLVATANAAGSRSTASPLRISVAVASAVLLLGVVVWSRQHSMQSAPESSTVVEAPRQEDEVARAVDPHAAEASSQVAPLASASSAPSAAAAPKKRKRPVATNPGF